MDTPPLAIRVSHLRKQYGELTAVQDASFEARAGEIFGLLGPNGAGKSTTIGCICGLLLPTSGHIDILSHDIVSEPAAAKAALGIVPQELALYEDLSATDNLAYWGSAYGLKGAALRQRVAEVLEGIGLADRAREPVKRFSGGMKRRLNFGCGIVHRPKALLLDEPTVGVDPQSRVRLIDLVRTEAARGTCVLYTTHYMEEAEQLCHRMAIMDHGAIIAQGTLGELRRILGERDLLRLTGRFDPERTRVALRSLGSAEVVHVESTSLILAMGEASRHLPAVFSALAAAGGEIHETVLTQPSLESVFIKLTGRELRE